MFIVGEVSFPSIIIVTNHNALEKGSKIEKRWFLGNLENIGGEVGR